MILITGAAGFIGFHLCRALLDQGHRVLGWDNINDYYDISLKNARLSILKQYPNFEFIHADINDINTITAIIDRAKQTPITHIVHLAAQAGVRYSLENPSAYVSSNLAGQVSMLELVRTLYADYGLKHFVYASSSSVYGGNQKVPFAVTDDVSLPVSLYAATKRSGELLVQSYAHLFGIPCTGLRFFTVYGAYGRPDMAYFSFTKDILAGKPIQIFNHGHMKRDFTYIDDIVTGIIASMNVIPLPQPIGGARHEIFNLGNHRSENLLDFVGVLEDLLDKKAEKIFAPMAAGDVAETFADIETAQERLGYQPKTSITQGLSTFVDWYKDFYGDFYGDL
jgi:UDP-glucuronate 4-epimerase